MRRKTARLGALIMTVGLALIALRVASPLATPSRRLRRATKA